MSTRKKYRSWAPTQSFLLPPSPLDWLPEGHLAYFILDVVDELDLSAIEARIHGKDARGNRPFPPQMMVGLLLYGYCVGVFSSRRLERATYEDVAFRVLSGGEHPHFTTINGFRKEHHEALRSLFLQVLKLCQKAGLVKLGHVALDGTKVQANASRHKAMSYKRLLKSELELTEEIAQLMSRAKEVDSDEDARFGEGVRDEDLPAELQRRAKRLATIREAKARLEHEAAQARARTLRKQAARSRERSESAADEATRKQAATTARKKAEQAKTLAPDKKDDDLDPPKTSDGLAKHEPRVESNGKPRGKSQMNFTDPDSRIMESGGTFLQAYNCQAAVDDSHQVIVAQAVSNNSPDNGALVPVLEQLQMNCQSSAQVTTADAGYWRPEAPGECERLGTDIYISTSRQMHSNREGKLSTEAPASERQMMREKLATDSGKAIYARRKAIVEPVFGQIKQARGFRRFMLRGIEKAQSEWSLICTGHNLLKLWRNGAMSAA